MTTHREQRELGRVASVIVVVIFSIAIGLAVGAAFHAAVSLVAPRSLGAQIPRPHPASDPAAVALYERHVRATGGAAPEFQHSIVESQIGESRATRIETFFALPGKMLVRTTMQGALVQEFGYDGTSGWTSSPETGVVRLSGAALDSMRRVVAAVHPRRGSPHFLRAEVHARPRRSRSSSSCA